MPLKTSPLNGSPMPQAQICGVEYEVCPASGGVWLDQGRLDALITLIREETLAVSPERWSYLDPPSKGDATPAALEVVRRRLVPSLRASVVKDVWRCPSAIVGALPLRATFFAERRILDRDQYASGQSGQNVWMRRTHLYLRPDTAAPPPSALIAYACDLTKAFDASLSVTNPRLQLRAPSHWLAGPTLAGMAREIERSTDAKTRHADDAIRAEAARKGVAVDVTEITQQWPLSPQDLVWRGRASDLCILGTSPTNDEQRLAVEAWLFASGRPCLLYPEQQSRDFATDTILVAWDFSRSAARAVGDAIPFLRRTKQTILLTVRGEKALDQAALTAPVLQYLDAHQINARVLETQLCGRKIGQAILDEAQTASADLLVMGAFGHSRLQEFVLGGATKEVLDASSMPLLMSH